MNQDKATIDLVYEPIQAQLVQVEESLLALASYGWSGVE